MEGEFTNGKYFGDTEVAENTSSGRTVLREPPSQVQAEMDPAVSVYAEGGAWVRTSTHYCAVSVGLLTQDMQLNPLIGQLLKQLGT